MIATKNSDLGDNSIKEKNLAHRVLGFLSSVRLTVLTLSFIALTSILGTIIKQNAPAEEYLSNYSLTTLKIIDFFQLYDIFHAPWFMGAIALFALNLIVCTLTRFFRKKKAVYPYIPDENTLSSMELHFSLKKDIEENAISFVRKRFGKKIYEGEDGLIFEKGSFSKYGVPLIHISILFVLTGSLIGLLWGYRGFVVLHKGDIKEKFVLRGGETKEVPFGFAIRCKDFNISFHPDGSPKDYVTTLEVIEGGRTVLEKEIRVNNPLNFRGLHLYQSSYGALPVFTFMVEGSEVVLKEHEEYETEGFIMVPVRFEETIHNFGPGVQVAFLEDGEPKTTWFLRDIPKMRERDLGGKKVILSDIRQHLWTGLEVTYDPGIIFVWMGFAMLLSGLYINFFVISGRIYIRRLPDSLIFAGVSSKHKERFRLEFEKIKRGLNDTVSS